MSVIEALISILTGIELILRGLGEFYLYGPLLLVAYGVYRLILEWRDRPSWSEQPPNKTPEATVAAEEVKRDQVGPSIASPSTIDPAGWLLEGLMDAKIGVLINLTRRHGMPPPDTLRYYNWLGAPVVDLGSSAWTPSFISRRWVLLPGISFRKSPAMTPSEFAMRFFGILPSTNVDLCAFATSIGRLNYAAAYRGATGTWISDVGLGTWTRAYEPGDFEPLSISEFDEEFPALPLVSSEMLDASQQHLLHRRELEFFYWEGRPAIVERGYAVCVPTGTDAWEDANAAEVCNSGRPITMLDFSIMFKTPPFPMKRIVG